MNILIDELPNSWEVDGEYFKLKTDYRQVLKFFNIMKNKEMDDNLKVHKILNLFFYKVPNSPKIWEFINYYVNAGETKEDNDNDRKVFDFDIDAGRIYSAFLQTYNINLCQVEMHWFIFMELLQALPENTRLMQIIDIRSRKVNKSDSKEYVRELRKLQNKYRIEDEQESQSLASFFMGKW